MTLLPVRRVALAALAALALPFAAGAQPRDFLALGALSVPDFEGSADKAGAPLLAGRIDFGPSGSLRIAGLTVQYNFMDAQSPWAFGPLAALRPKRDADVKDDVVQRLREVDGAGELGAFLEYGLRDALARGDRLAVGAEARGGKGSQFALTASYLAPERGAFRFGADLRVVQANAAYMERYFSVDADNSARSGLPVYAASSGVKNIALGMTASHDIGRDWLLLGRLGWTRLLGDARDSPIVALRGRAGAATAGLALGYRF